MNHQRSPQPLGVGEVTKIKKKRPDATAYLSIFALFLAMAILAELFSIASRAGYASAAIRGYDEATGSITLVNAGNVALTEFVVFVDGNMAEADYNAINPGEEGRIKLLTPLEVGQHSVKIVSLGAETAAKINVEPIWQIELIGFA